MIKKINTHLNGTITPVPVHIKDKTSLDIIIYSDILKNTLNIKNYDKYILRIIISNDRDFYHALIPHDKIKYMIFYSDIQPRMVFSEEYEINLIIKEIPIRKCNEILRKRQREEELNYENKRVIPLPPAPDEYVCTNKSTSKIEIPKTQHPSWAPVFVKEDTCIKFENQNRKNRICSFWFFTSCRSENCSYLHPDNVYKINARRLDYSNKIYKLPNRDLIFVKICNDWFFGNCKKINCMLYHPILLN